MKWDTKRVEEENFTGAIAKNIMKHSQEYYILAIPNFSRHKLSPSGRTGIFVGDEK